MTAEMIGDESTLLCFLPAAELAARIRRRDLSPVEVVESYLRRIESRNPIINAYTLVCGDQAMDAARTAEAAVMKGGPLGALHGVPIAIKDLDDVAGIPTSMGSLAVGDRIPTRSATAVARLLAAGAIVLGKTNTPEFGHEGITDNLRFGPTSTPYRPGFNSGGSSGGSAAAVADGMAALAQRTDGGGSVRIPASCCGVVGFKPSYGRIPSVTRPDGFLWGHPLVHIGPLARTVEDAALMTSIMAGPHPRDPLSLPDDGVDYLRGAARLPHEPRIAYAPGWAISRSPRRSQASCRRPSRPCAATGARSTSTRLISARITASWPPSGCAPSPFTTRPSPITGRAKARTSCATAAS